MQKLRIKLTINVPKAEFIRRLHRFVDTDKEFSSHPHKIKKPFYGDLNQTSFKFKIKNTPNLLYRDSTILIVGKVEEGEVEIFSKLNNPIFTVFLIMAFCCLTIILFITDEENYAFIGIISVLGIVAYVLFAYHKNKNEFLNILKEISKENN